MRSWSFDSRGCRDRRLRQAVVWRSAALVALALFVSACSTEDERANSLDQDAGGSPRETVGQTETAMDFEVLAEDFHDVGYTTASFSANDMIDADFGFDRGFDTFESPDLIEIMKARRLGETHERFRLLDRLREWNDQRDKEPTLLSLRETWKDDWV